MSAIREPVLREIRAIESGTNNMSVPWLVDALTVLTAELVYEYRLFVKQLRRGRRRQYHYEYYWRNVEVRRAQACVAAWKRRATAMAVFD